MLDLFTPKIVVPAKSDYLPVLRNFVSQIGKKYRFTKHEINAFKISIDEACTNIIKHGYKEKNNGSITLKVRIKNDRLILELIDHGKSFDPNTIHDPNISSYVQNGKKGGLGIFIMRKFLDAIEYEVSSLGNILRLTKLRQVRSAEPVFPILSALRRMKERIFQT